MRPWVFENIRTFERVLCDDIRNSQTIDGVLYLRVHKSDNNRTFLQRKDALRKVKTKTV